MQIAFSLFPHDNISPSRSVTKSAGWWMKWERPNATAVNVANGSPQRLINIFAFSNSIFLSTLYLSIRVLFFYCSWMFIKFSLWPKSGQICQIQIWKSMKKISDLKVPELHDELTKRALPKKGKKQELIEVRNRWAHTRYTLLLFFLFRWAQAMRCALV